MVARQSGLAPIEFGAVVVLLGVASAVALPNLPGIATQTRIAALERKREALLSAAALAHGEWLAQGRMGTSVSVAGVAVMLDEHGWPRADRTGIGRTVDSNAGEFSDAGARIFMLDGRTACRVVYDLSGTASPPSATVISTGC